MGHRRSRASHKKSHSGASAAIQEADRRGYALVTVEPTSEQVGVYTDPKMLRHFSAVTSNTSPAWSPYLIGASYGRSNMTIQGMKGLSPPLRELLLPSPGDRDGIINRIYSYARDMWLVRSWVDKVTDFGSAGFELSSEDEAKEKFCQTLMKSVSWEAIDYRLHRTLALSEQVVLWWMYYGSAERRSPDSPSEGLYVPKWVEQIPPGVLTFTTLGGVALRANLLEPLSTIARKRAKDRTAEEAAYLQEFPLDLQLAAGKQGAAAVYPLANLDKEPNVGRMGYLVINHWGKDDWQKWPIPNLYSILADFEYVLLCEDIDFAAIHRMRAGIVLWKIGPKDPSPENPGPPPKVLRATEEKIKQSLSDLAPDIFVGNDFTVEWVFPPKEFFDPAKYDTAMRRIVDLLGIPYVFYAAGRQESGDSGSQAYAASYIATKPFAQSIHSRRRMIRMPSEKWYWLMCYINKIGASEGAVSIRYDPNVLMEDVNILRKAQFGATQGILSNETVAEALGVDWKSEITRRKRELKMFKETPELGQPYFAVTRGSAPGGEQGSNNGRPSGSDSPKTPNGAQPRPSTAQAEDEVETSTANALEIELAEAEEAREYYEDSLEALDAELDGPWLTADAMLLEFGPIGVSTSIEVTKSWIHVPVATKKFASYRYSKSKKGGIKLLYGIPEEGPSEVATVLFKKPKWTLEKAKKWVKAHYGGGK